jgi:hypothetical protein
LSIVPEFVVPVRENPDITGAMVSTGIEDVVNVKIAGDGVILPLASSTTIYIAYVVPETSPPTKYCVDPLATKNDPESITLDDRAFCHARICATVGAIDPLGRITKYPVPDSLVQRVSLAPVCVILSSNKRETVGGVVST